MSEEKNNIELRSEEIQEIIGSIPSKIIRWGITIISFTIFVIIIGSAFFKYPDIVYSTIIVTTENPPASIIARTTGKIDTIFVEDNQVVKENQILALIENTADYEDIKHIKMITDNYNFSDSNLFMLLDRKLELGEIQTDYSNFTKSLTDYNNFLQIHYHHKKIDALKKQISATQDYISGLNLQKEILLKELLIAEKQLFRDSNLFIAEAISSLDFEQTQSIFLQKKLSYQNAKTNIFSTKIQITQLQQNILDLEIEYINQKKQLESELSKNFDILKNSIKIWEQNYILKTPINGKVVFTNIWKENQNITTGDNVFNIIPLTKSKLKGRLQLPIEGSGKVEINQKVSIKFNNYPYMEYGTVSGIIKSISPVPTENFYLVLVDFPDSLTTNYGKKLTFAQEMSGSAEIITQNNSLLYRIFNPLKFIKEKFSKNE